MKYFVTLFATMAMAACAYAAEAKKEEPKKDAPKAEVQSWSPKTYFSSN